LRSGRRGRLATGVRERDLAERGLERLGEMDRDFGGRGDFGVCRRLARHQMRMRECRGRHNQRRGAEHQSPQRGTGKFE
jgi:hypothetical protein